MRSKSRSRSRSPHRSSRRRSRSPRRRSPFKKQRSESRSRSRSPSELTSQPPIKDSWAQVKKDKSNFDAWMHLLNLVDQYNELEAARAMFDRFLDRYPYCYGFWKKYADLERRNNNLTHCIKVWERALLEIPLSVDLWLGFLGFMRELAPLSEEGPEKLYRLYDNALNTCGLEFNSDRLWNEAIAWHESCGNWRKVAEIYDRLLQTPTAQYKSHYERYITIINMYEPDILLDDAEYEEIVEKMRKRLDCPMEQLVTEETVVAEAALTQEGEDTKPTMIRRKKHHPDALSFFRDEMTERRTRWHEKTGQQLAIRIAFEEQIKRPYFHVKELETSQLKNWREYLDFEAAEGDEERTRVLYERCMIACALYDTMWLKFARWTQKKRGSNSARNIYERARVHCPNSVNICIAYSSLEEVKEEFEKAEDILKKYERKNPGYAAIALRMIGVKRRKVAKDSNPDYSNVIQDWENLIHHQGTPRHLSSFYSIKLARFHQKCRNDRRLAEKVLRRALERDRDNIQLHLQLIDLAYTDPDFSQKRVLEAFDEAVSARLEDSDRLRLSQRKLDFLEDVGEDIQLLQEHTEQHQQLLKEVENPQIQTRKRKTEREYRDRDRGDLRRRDRNSSSQYGAAAGAQAVFYPAQGQMYDYGAAAAYAYPGQGYY